MNFSGHLGIGSNPTGSRSDISVSGQVFVTTAQTVVRFVPASMAIT